MKPEMLHKLAQLQFEEHEILSGSARVDDIKGHPQGRGSRAVEARQKIRKVGELIRLSRKMKAQRAGEESISYPESGWGLPAGAGGSSKGG